MAISLGVGAAPAEAAGSGLLTALTVAGSAAAEAYATNRAADRLKQAQKEVRHFSALIDPITALRARGQALLIEAAAVLSAGSREAVASVQAVTTEANPSSRDMRTFGALSPMPPETILLPLDPPMPELVGPPEIIVAQSPAVVASADLVAGLHATMADAALPSPTGDVIDPITTWMASEPPAVVATVAGNGSES